MQEMIRLQVNGEAKEWRDGATVADLLKDLGITAERVAVEVNFEILDRTAFAQRRLKDGDRVEILSFIGGGESVGQEGVCHGRHAHRPMDRQRFKERFPRFF